MVKQMSHLLSCRRNCRPSPLEAQPVFTSSGARELGRSKGGRLNLSRGEVLRHLGEWNRSSVTDAGDSKGVDIDSATFVLRRLYCEQRPDLLLN